MQKHNSLYQIQRAQNQEIVLSVVAFGDQPVEGVDQAQYDIPLESLLKFEELPKRRVAGQLAETLFGWAGWRVFARVDGPGALRVASTVRRKADLRQQALDLAQALTDLGPVVGGEIIKCEGEQCFHILGGLSVPVTAERTGPDWLVACTGKNDKIENRRA